MPSNQRSKTFGVGSCAYIKRLGPGKVPIPIIIKETLGKSLFKVELYDSNGQPNNILKDLSSQQMRWPKEHESHPGETTESTEEDGTGIETINSPPTPPLPTRRRDRVMAALTSPFNRRRRRLNSSSSNSSSSSDNDIPHATDGDIPPAFDGDDDEGGDDDGDGDDDEGGDDDHDLALEEDVGGDGAMDGTAVEMLDDKYKQKWDQYQTEKDGLIEEARKIQCKPPKQQKLDVGCIVKERSGEKRTGTILADDRDKDNHDFPCWKVQFGEDFERHVKSSAISRVKDNRIFEWTVIKESYPDDPLTPYQDHGVFGFDFSAFDDAKVDVDGEDYDFPFLQLLIHLWPGSWTRQLNNLNRHIENKNLTLQARQRIRFVTANDWWKVWGIIFASASANKGGELLFEKATIRKLTPTVNFGKDGLDVMSYKRFKSIKENLRFAFFDHLNEGDPYHPITLLIDGFNDNRRRVLATAIKIVLDESMSPFRPRTTKTSLLPNLSFIFRKPKPLGTEYKNACCTTTGLLVNLEVQRGQLPMKKKKFFGEAGSTAACSLRLILGSIYSGKELSEERKRAYDNEKRHLIVADSWFGSVKLAECLKLLRRGSGSDYVIDRDAKENPNGHEIIAAVKTNSSWFPKKFIESTMKEWPSGSHLVLECCAPETDVHLVSIGYKYNASKVLCFVMTKNAGSTAIGSRPYIARFPDGHGNLIERQVKRPEVISEYFEDSNRIDTHNHLRQNQLALEQHWLTTDPWFRNSCTIVGQTVIDALQAVKFQAVGFNRRNDLTVADFADCLAFDCINNNYEGAARSPRVFLQPDTGNDPMTTMRQQQHVFAEGQRDLAHRITDQLTDQFMDSFRGLVVNTNLPAGHRGLAVNTNSPSDDLQMPIADIAEHVLVPIPQQNNKEGRSVKRRCIICGTDTRKMCNHPTCKTRSSYCKGKEYHGTSICPETVKGIKNIRKMKSIPNNTKTCLQIHKERIRAQKVAEYKARSGF